MRLQSTLSAMKRAETLHRLGFAGVSVKNPEVAAAYQGSG
jgi:hypothetical protein